MQGLTGGFLREGSLLVATRLRRENKAFVGAYQPRAD